MIDTAAICPQIINNASPNWIILLCKRGGKALWRKMVYQNILYDSVNQLQPCLWPLSPVGPGRKGWGTLWGVGSQIQGTTGVLPGRMMSCTCNGRISGLQNPEALHWEDRAREDRGFPRVSGKKWSSDKSRFWVDCKLREQRVWKHGWCRRVGFLAC